MIAHRGSWFPALTVLLIAVAGCGNPRSTNSPDYRLIESYLRDIDDPALRITLDTRTQGVSYGELQIPADAEETCLLTNMTFHLPAGIERSEGSRSIDCPESLNGPGSYSGVFLDQNCQLTNSVLPRDDGGWKMFVTASCWAE